MSTLIINILHRFGISVMFRENKPLVTRVVKIIKIQCTFCKITGLPCQTYLPEKKRQYLSNTTGNTLRSTLQGQGLCLKGGPGVPYGIHPSLP
jgi:hypothetical protein